MHSACCPTVLIYLVFLCCIYLGVYSPWWLTASRPSPSQGDVETPARGWLVIAGHGFFAWFQPELCWLPETLARLSLPTTLGWLLCARQLLQGLTQNRRLYYILNASLIIYSRAFLSLNLPLAMKSKIPEKQHWAPTLSSGEDLSSGPVLPCWPWRFSYKSVLSKVQLLYLGMLTQTSVI